MAARSALRGLGRLLLFLRRILGARLAERALVDLAAAGSGITFAHEKSLRFALHITSHNEKGRSPTPSQARTTDPWQPKTLTSASARRRRGCRHRPCAPEPHPPPTHAPPAPCH